MRERVRSTGGDETNLSCTPTKEFAEMTGFFYEGVRAD
jgi:hypothetical protein